MSKTMHLFASTDSAGSKCSIDMGITKEDYDAMSEKQRVSLIGEWRQNVVDIWVQEAESDGSELDDALSKTGGDE